MTPSPRPVAFVAGRDPELEAGGGHSGFVRAHARAAALAGYEPHLFAVGPDTRTYETGYGIIHRLRSHAPFHQSMIVFQTWRLQTGLIDFLRAQPEPRLVHGFGVWSHAGVRAGRRLASRGLPMRVITSSYATILDETISKRQGALSGYGLRRRLQMLRNEAWVRGIVHRHERTAYEGSNLVLYNYDNVGRLIRKRHGPDIRLRKIDYASEAAFRRHEGPQRTETGGAPPLIVAVSRHDPRKGVDVLIRALALLGERGVAFRAVLAGEGFLLEDDRRLCRALGLSDRVEIPGVVPDAFDLLCLADVYCLPSRAEQSGSLAVLEALQAGAAIVASGCDGIPEDLTDGGDALLTTPGDAASLAAALERVLMDAPLRERLGAAARQTFLARFSADGFSRQLGAIYEELAAELQAAR